MKSFSCDLHIHSALSPCGSLEMSPRDIVRKAKEVGLDIIAITDHNMVENALHACEIGRKYDVLVLPGMELQTAEEIHLLIIFESNKVALDFQATVYGLLPPVANEADYFGDQVVVNENDEIVRFEERLLLNSVQISLDAAVALAKSLGAIVIPSHIDASAFSIISQIGYIPETLQFDGLEIRDRNNIPEVMPFITKKGLPFLTFSDAHYLADVGKRRTIFNMEEPSFEGILNALAEMRRP